MYLPLYKLTTLTIICVFIVEIESVKHILGSWMGLADFKIEGDLRWVGDSSAVSYSHWYRVEPSNSKNADCVHLWSQANYECNDAPCHLDNMGYICECSHVSL